MKRCILGNQRCCCRLSSDPCRRPPADSKKNVKKMKKIWCKMPCRWGWWLRCVNNSGPLLCALVDTLQRSAAHSCQWRRAAWRRSAGLRRLRGSNTQPRHLFRHRRLGTKVPPYRPRPPASTQLEEPIAAHCSTGWPLPVSSSLSVITGGGRRA